MSALVIEAKRLSALLAEASHFASDDNNRPILNAVRIVATGGRCQLMATDSYVLGTWTFDAPGELNVLVSVEDVKRIVGAIKAELKVYRAPPLEWSLEVDEAGSLWLSGRAGTLEVRPVPGESPAWRTLFDRTPALDGTVCLSAYVLDKLSRIELGYKPTKRGRASAPALRFEFRGGQKPAWIAAEHDGVSFVGLSMPVRSCTEGELTAPEVVGARGREVER